MRSPRHDADSISAFGPSHAHDHDPAFPQCTQQTSRSRPLDLGDFVADCRSKLRGSAIGHDLAVGEKDRPIGRLGFEEIVGGEEDGGAPVPALRVQYGPHLLAVLGIEADRRLVEDQEIGPVECRASDVHEPPPSTR